MKLEDFIYHLPREFIAQKPLKKRDEAKLLVIHKNTGKIEHKIFRQIVEYLNPGDALVINTTRVISARIYGKRQTGGKVKFLLLKKEQDRRWIALLESSKKLKELEQLQFDKGIVATVLQGLGKKRYLLEFNCEISERLDEVGQIPLPPYIKRPHGPHKQDTYRYQTVYAKQYGSIAAPTAGLHFTKSLLADIKKIGVEVVNLLLHIGAGTFKPVEVEDVSLHHMEEEFYEVSKEAVEKLKQAKRIIAVGTSVCRILESVDELKPCSGFTDLFIYPPYKFKHVDALITNFHLPASTNLMLVCAFASRDLIFKAYREAMQKGYRFYSYGDATLII